MKKVFLLLALSVSLFAAATDEVATITISGTVTSNKTFTDSKGNEWAFVADPVSSLAGESGAIKLGSNSKNAKSLSFESSDYDKKWVKSIEIEGYSNENSYDQFVVYPGLYVHDSLVNKGGSFYGTAKLKQTVTNANKVTGKVRFTMERQDSKKKAIFFYSAKITYTDIPKEVNSVTLDKDTLEIKELTSGQLIATVDPNTINPEWVSVDETIATVKDGIVRGESEGTTLVIAKAEDKADTCVIIVTRDESTTTRSFQIVFNSGTATQEKEYTTLDDLIFSGKKYVESFDKDGYSILASNDQGVKLASGNTYGQLTLHLAATATMHFDSIRVFTKGHADKNTIKVNGQSQQTSTTFTGYKFTQSGNDIILRAETGKQVYVSKLVLYYREYTIVEPTALTLDKDTIVVEKGLSDTLTATILPSNATERDVTWTCNSTDVETSFKDKTAIFKGIHITKEPIQVICTSTYSDQLADTCYVIVKDRTLKEPVYTLMTSTDDLKNGDKIIIARQASEKLMGVYTSGNNIPAVTGIFSEDKTRIEEGEAGVYTLEIIQKGVFAFKDINGQYLCYNPSASNANNMQAQTALDNNAKWTCNKVTDGMCDWANVGTTTRFIQYNSNADVFACYTNYGNVYVYYRHDENAGSITPEPETIAWEARIKDSAAHFSQEVTIAAEHLAMEMEVVIEQDSIEPYTYPETRIQHKGVFAASVNELPAEGGKVTVTFDIQDLVIVAADTTITANLVLTGIDLNTDLIEKTIPVTVKLLREPKVLSPISIDSMVIRGMKAVGGVAGSTVATSKDTCLLQDVVLVYQSKYEYIVKDETGYLAVASTIDANLGDTLSGVRGVFKTDHMRFTFLLCEADITVKAGTAAPAPEVFTAMPQYREDMSRYVQYQNVHFNGSGNITIGDQSLVALSNYGIEAPKDKEAPYQVDGIVSFYGNNTTQLILTNVVIDPSFRRPVSGIVISDKTKEMIVGQTDSLSATVLPEGEHPTGAYNKNVIWSTNKPSMIDLDQTGKFTVLYEGQALIIATAEDETKGIFADTCVINAKSDETKRFALVGAVSELKEGDKILIVDTLSNEAAGLFGTKNFSDAAITRVGDTVLYAKTDTATIFTLGKNGAYWTLTANGQLVGVSEEESKKMTNDGTGITTWTITRNDSAAVIQNTTTVYSSYSKILHNGQANIFSVYGDPNMKNKMYPVLIFKDAAKRDSVYVTDVQIQKAGRAIDTLRLEEAQSETLTALVIPDNADNQKVHWSSSNDSVASVNNGVITANRYGEAVITVRSDENESIYDTCVVMVTAISGSRYELVMSVDSLHAGDTIIFVNKSAKKANGARNGEKYLSAVDVHIAGNTIITNDAQDIILSGTADQWILTADSRLGNKDKSNDLVNGTTATYTITIGSTGDAKVTSSIKGEDKSGNTEASFFYNGSGSGRFALYTSTSMAAIQIYRLTHHQDIPIPVEGVELDQTELTLRVGDSAQIVATVLPEDAKNKNISWGVVDETIATVHEGMITAVAKGQTAVWVKTEEGNFTDTCYITVKQSIILPDVTWNIVQELDSLQEGVKVFFGNTAKDYVMGLYDYDVSKSNIRGVAAVYDELRHKVTVSESYAYIVHKSGDKFYFEDLDGRYLYVYNENKNLSVSTELSNQNKWTVTVDDSVAYLKNVHYSSFGMYFNKTAANALYSTYSLKDANLADIYLYSNNAPEWIEPVLYPELTILDGKDTVTNLLDFGEVVYDDGWGQEVDPYNASKTLTFKANKDVRDSIYIRVQNGKVFYTLTDQLPAKGGTASVIFSTTKAGEYTDSLFVDCGDIHYAMEIKAKAVTQEEVKPTLTLSTSQINLYLTEENDLSDTAHFTFSVKNLAKPLYLKWETGSVPELAGEEVSIIAGNDSTPVYYEQVANLGTDTRTNEQVTISAFAYTEGIYESSLYFYSFVEGSKTEYAFEKRVQLIIHVNDTTQPTPTAEQLIITKDELPIDTLALTIFRGEKTSEQLGYTYTPIEARQPNINWLMLNTNIATVDETGLVQAKAVGTTLLVLSADYGTPDTCVIVVRADSSEIEGEYFVKVKKNLEDWSGRYLIVYEEDEVALDGSIKEFDVSYNSQSVDILFDEAVAVTEATKAISFTISAIPDGYAVMSRSGLFIDYDPNDTQYKNNNGIIGYASPRPLTISYSDSVTVATPLGNILKYNPTEPSGSARGALFRFYRESSQGVFNIALYRYIGTQWPEDPQGIEAPSVDGQSHKVLRDGQILILRDNHVYTILGNKVQ